MSKIVTVPLGKLPMIFNRTGFNQDEMVSILFALIQLWKLNDFHSDMTVEYILTELDLEPLAAQMLILEAGCYMTEVGNIVRAFALEGRLIRWNVTPYVILLEIEHDTEILHSYSENSGVDGCQGNGESVSFPF